MTAGRDPGGLLLDVRHLRTHFHTPEGVIKAVEDVSFSVRRGEVMGIVGESGCGKSVTALSLLKLIDRPGRIVSGEILYDGIDLATLDDEAMREIRGRRISIIFQDPMTSLNPLLRTGTQVAETVSAHAAVSWKDALQRALRLFGDTGIQAPEKRIRDFPHHFSGGMRQRVMIATALANEPDIIIADEATTALDVTIQAQILDLLLELVSRRKASLLVITHDLSIVAQACDAVLIMYTGRIVERGTTREIFSSPRHPYTIGLLNALPGRKRKGEKLFNIPGVVPVPRDLPVGCDFKDRCPFFMEGTCDVAYPPWRNLTQTHSMYCHLRGEEPGA
jgi:oligopeptide/dipeptide ABC transporter ATP-binding protein